MNEFRMVGFPCECKRPLNAEVVVLGEGDWSETNVHCKKCGARFKVRARSREYGLEVRHERL